MRRAARRSRAPRARRVSRVSVKQVVKNVLARQVETKTKGLSPSTRTFRYPTAGALYDQQNVVPLGFTAAGLQLLQGVGDGQRIGNKVRVKQLRFNFVLRPRPYEAGTNPQPTPQMIRIVLFYSRQDPVANPAISSDFFDYNSSDVGPAGSLEDMLAPINENRYVKLAERTVKLGYAEAYGAGSNTSSQQFTNNDYKLNVLMKWDVTKHIPKVVRYDDDTSTASTRGLWAAFLVAPADGTIGASGTSPVNMEYWLDARYTDA